MTLVSAVDGTGTVSCAEVVPGIVSCALGDLLPGGAPDDTPTSGSGGPSDAQAVVVVDDLPLTAKKMVVQFLTQGSVGNITNRAAVSSATPDPVMANNTDTVNNVVKGGTGTT